MSEPTAPPLEAILSRPEHGARSIVDLALKRDPTRPPTADAPRPRTPRGELTRRMHNRPVRVPRNDWTAVISGAKRMYRTYSDSWRDRFAPLFPPGEEFPRPAVIYSQPEHARRYDSAIAIIEYYRQEPLGAISAADIAAEGFRTLNHFRLYWKRRYIRWGWRPRDMISVVELRPFTPADHDPIAAWLFDRLYGEWLP